MNTIVTSDWSRAGNSSRFTPGDWTASNIDHYNSADASRQDSERIRNEAVRMLVYRYINIFVVMFKYFYLQGASDPRPRGQDGDDAARR